MELTKEQIQTIEQRLEKSGVNYWDIRIEILDHLVTDIEKRLEKGESLASATESSFHSLGMNGDLSGLTKSRLLEINKIVGKKFFNRAKNLFAEPKYLVSIILFTVLYYYVFAFLSTLLFKIVTLILLIAPIAFGITYYFVEYFKSRRSGYLIYTSFYIFFAFLILNIFIQFAQPDGVIPVSSETQRIIWFLVTIVNSVFSLAGILEHLKTVKKIGAVRKRLYK